MTGLLKRMNNPVQMPIPDGQDISDQQAIAEIKQKLSDREWRLDNLYYIQDKQGQKVKFKRNHSQMMFWKAIWYMNIILKDRQRGFSTLMAIYILDTCLFNSNTNAGIIDISLSDAKKKLAKIQFAYDCLPDWIKKAKPLKTSNKENIEFSNGSSIQVGTSHRGGTLQILHISELGKIAAKYPDKAREIRTGALNTIAPGQVVVIESTAEGAFGEFYDLCQEAEALKLSGARLTKIDYKFHFFGWTDDGRDEEPIDPDDVVFTKEHLDYFEKVEVELGISISPEKRAWYVKKSHQQKDDMKREFPATPKEAFEQAIEGGIFTKQIRIIRKNGQFTKIPIDPQLPVNTFWDLGLNDLMTIFFHQQTHWEHRFINYMEGHGEGYEYYADEMNRWAIEHNVRFGAHFAPHDIEQRKLGRNAKTGQEHAAEVGINFLVVPRCERKNDAWTAARKVLPLCWFHEEYCAQGFKHLTNYRLKWDDRYSVWSNKPVHDDASHGADGFMTFAQAVDEGMIVSPGVMPHNYGQQSTRRPHEQTIHNQPQIIDPLEHF